jgi:hypothetical protein
VPTEPTISTAVVRDLLAIAQVLHGRRAAEGAPDMELHKLEAAAKAFVASLSTAQLSADRLVGRAACVWAERGLLLLAEALCQEAASARVFVSAWGQRLTERY